MVPRHLHAACRNLTCPVCLERCALCCLAVTPCAHAVCMECAATLLCTTYNDDAVLACPECRCSENDNGVQLPFFSLLYGPHFRDRAIQMLTRMSQT